MRASRLSFLLMLSVASVAAGCASESEDDFDDAESDVSAIKSYWADAKRLDLGDLSRVTAGFATDGLNNAIAGNATGVGARFEQPAVFAERAEPNRLIPGDMEIRGLDTVVSGLAARFGETELSTEVNAARLEHLRKTSDDYFVESGFTLRAGAVPDWNFQAGGLGLRLGFEANTEISSRVIVATKTDGLRALVSAPLAAAKQMRGFVYPRSIADIAAMKPGEMFALRGNGKLGANFGVGAPIFVAEPTGGLAYSIVVSAGVSTVVSGQVDVQLQRLAGDEVVVDLGVENGKGVSFNASIGDQWGVKGICDDGQRCLRPVTVGGVKVDLARLVEKAIERQMNKYLTFSASASSGKSSSRVSLSRFRLNLRAGNPAEVARALEHLLKFDLRLAQALANRDLGDARAAVRQDFDAVRASTTSTRNFGFELLGMNVFHRAVVDREGTFVLQTPDGARAVLFDYLRKEGGFFSRKHAFSRTGVGAQVVDGSDPSKYRSAANLFMQTMSADSLNNEFLTDNVDAIILGLAGKNTVDTLDRFANTLERTLRQRCPMPEDNSKGWNETCNVKLLDDPAMAELWRGGMAAIEPTMKHIPESARRVVREAAAMRLRLQSVGLRGGGGPKASILVDLRLDDAALDILTSQSREAYLSAVREYIATVRAVRVDVHNPEGKAYFGNIANRDWADHYDRMADRFIAGSRAYRRVTNAERALPQILSGKRFISHPLGIRFKVEADERRTLESVVLNSTSHERALTAASIFDGIYSEASAFDAPLDPQHATMFPLMALVPAKNLEVGMNISIDINSNFINPMRRFKKIQLQSVSAISTGSEVSTLGAGMFDLARVASEP